MLPVLYRAKAVPAHGTWLCQHPIEKMYFLGHSLVIFLSFTKVFPYLKYVDLANLLTFDTISKFHCIIRPTFSGKKNTNYRIPLFLNHFSLVKLCMVVFSYKFSPNYDFDFDFMHILS